jgi:hypothetical protein
MIERQRTKTARILKDLRIIYQEDGGGLILF